MTLSLLPEPVVAEPAPMPFLEWVALHIEERLPEVARCERHGVVLETVDDEQVCLACRNGTRPARRMP